MVHGNLSSMTLRLTLYSDKSAEQWCSLSGGRRAGLHGDRIDFNTMSYNGCCSMNCFAVLDRYAALFTHRNKVVEILFSFSRGCWTNNNEVVQNVNDSCNVKFMDCYPLKSIAESFEER